MVPMPCSSINWHLLMFTKQSKVQIFPPIVIVALKKNINKQNSSQMEIKTRFSMHKYDDGFLRNSSCLWNSKTLTEHQISWCWFCPNSVSSETENLQQPSEAILSDQLLNALNCCVWNDGHYGRKQFCYPLKNIG